MQPFRSHTGGVVALDRSNVDTDQIIPKQFLKRIERTGFGQYLFFDWRFDEAGNPVAEFELNASRCAGATILIAGRNFGCGSSREHAVWALQDYGFRAVIAPSFADIFYSNSLANGLLPVALDECAVRELTRRARTVLGYQLTVDLETRHVRDRANIWPFAIEDHARRRLLNGLDDIELTLQQLPAIERYESRPASAP